MISKTKLDTTSKMQLDTASKTQLDTTSKTQLDTTSKTQLDTTSNIQLDVVVNKYFLDKEKEISKKFNLDKNYKYHLSKDANGKHTIEIKDTNNKLIMTAEYNLIGIYNLYNSVWYWAWNIQFIDRILAEKSKIVRGFANKIKDNYDKYEQIDAEQYYYIAKNGNFYTSSDNIMKMVKLMLYLTGGLWYIPICQGEGKDGVTCSNLNNDNSSIKRIEYLMITKIINF